MRKLCLALCLLILPASLGCAQCLFWMFGDYYSAAGPSSDDRERHYNAQVEASEAYAAANPPRTSESASSWRANALHEDE